MKLKRGEKYFVYIVKCAKGTFYTGSTNDIEKRIALHNSGKGAKYLRGRGPVNLVYVKGFKDRSSALKEEIRIKRLGRKKKEGMVKKYKA